MLGGFLIRTQVGMTGVFFCLLENPSDRMYASSYHMFGAFLVRMQISMMFFFFPVCRGQCKFLVRGNYSVQIRHLESAPPPSLLTGGCKTDGRGVGLFAELSAFVCAETNAEKRVDDLSFSTPLFFFRFLFASGGGWVSAFYSSAGRHVLGFD